MSAVWLPGTFFFQAPFLLAAGRSEYATQTLDTLCEQNKKKRI